MQTLNILSAGAAQALVKSVQDDFTREHAVSLRTTFGGVGAMRETMLSGVPCDVMITSELMLMDLIESGHVVPESRRDLGRVSTAVAVRDDEPLPDISSVDHFIDCLHNAAEILCTDPRKSTGGGHFAVVLKKLGMDETVQHKLVVYPNGATAMTKLASSAAPGLIACAQATEILYTPGVRLVGPLPDDLSLSTIYTMCVTAQSSQMQLSREFIDLLTGERTLGLRVRSGFEQAPSQPA